MLLLIGLATLISVRPCCGVIVVTPQGNPVYFPVGVPATISCTVKAVSGNVEDLYLLVQLLNSTNTLSALGCTTRRTDPLTVHLDSQSFGNVSVNRSFPDQSTIICSYTLPVIRDSTYSCVALAMLVPSEERSFEVVTTKKPDGFYINNGRTELAANEGDSLVITCVVLNSKPAFSLNWDAPDIANAGCTLTSQSSNNDYSNSSMSLTVTASAAMNGRRLACVASSSVPTFGNLSASVILNIYYGPTVTEPSVVVAQASVITIECPLLSNPAIQSYTWSLNFNPLNCTTRFCNVSYSGSIFSLVTCQGRNPKTGGERSTSVTIKWPYTATFSSLISETTTNVPLAIGITVGAVVIVVIAIVAAITVKRKNSLNRSAPATNDRETNVKNATNSRDRGGEDVSDKIHLYPGQTKESYCDDG